MSENWYFRNRQRTWGPFSIPEIKNLAAAGLLLAEDLMWPEAGDSRQAVESRSVLDFSSLQPLAVPSPDWLDDVPEEKGPAPVQWENRVTPDWLEDVARWDSAEQQIPLQPGEATRPPQEDVKQEGPVADQHSVAPHTESNDPEAASTPVSVPALAEQSQIVPSAPEPKQKTDDSAPVTDVISGPVVEGVASSATLMPAVHPDSPHTLENRQATPLLHRESAEGPAVTTVGDLSPAPKSQQQKSAENAIVGTTTAREPRTTVIRLMGFDPQTGQILDPDRFRKWLKEKPKSTSGTSKSIQELFQEARRAVENWIDADVNRDLIMKADWSVIRREGTLRECVERYNGYGPAILDKLWHHAEFMAENRRKFLTATEGK